MCKYYQEHFLLAVLDQHFEELHPAKLEKQLVSNALILTRTMIISHCFQKWKKSAAIARLKFHHH